MNSCLNCLFAVWRRTAAGRPHPSGDGECNWRMPKVVIPRAYYYVGGANPSHLPSLSGGYIERKRPHADCKAWQEMPPASLDT